MGKVARRSGLPAAHGAGPEQHWDDKWLHETQRWLHSMQLPAELPAGRTEAHHTEVAARLPDWCDFDGDDVAAFVRRCEDLWAGLDEVRALCARGEWVSALPVAQQACTVAASLGNDRVATHSEPFDPAALEVAVRRILSWAGSAGLDGDAAAELLAQAGTMVLVLDRGWAIGDAAALGVARAHPGVFEIGGRVAEMSADERFVVVAASGAGQLRLCKRHHFHDSTMLERGRWVPAMWSLQQRGWAQWPPPVTELLADVQRSLVDRLADDVGVGKSGSRRAVAGRIAARLGGADALNERVWPTWQFEDRHPSATSGASTRGDELAERINATGSFAWYGPRQYVVGIDDPELRRLRRDTRNEVVEQVLATLYPQLY